MALQRRQCDESNVPGRRIEQRRQFLLLLDREQNIGFDTDDQDAFQVCISKSVLDAAPMIGRIERVHGAGQVQVAVCVKAAGELLPVSFQIGFDLEFVSEVCFIALRDIDTSPSETLPPLRR